MFFFAGAGLAQPVWDKLDARRRAGMRRAHPHADRPGHDRDRAVRDLRQRARGEVGPHRPAGARPRAEAACRAATSMEVRYRGPNVTPGYWRAPEQTAESFDAEGFYCSGDAAKPMEPAHPERGFMFDGRIAEDFKLSTGTFVSVGPLRATDHRRRRPAGAGRGGRRHQPQRDRHPAVPAPRRLPRLRRPAGQCAGAHRARPTSTVRAFLQRLVDVLHSRGTGSATRVARALVLAEPPSIDRGEITDKGSINQRAVLTASRRRRRAHVPRPRPRRDRAAGALTANDESKDEGTTMKIAGQVALVTGGASGLGAETARELARRGAKVAVLDRNGDGANAVAAQIVAAHGEGSALGIACDITSTDSIVAALAAAQHSARRAAHRHEHRRHRHREARHRQGRHADAARGLHARRSTSTSSAPST